MLGGRHRVGVTRQWLGRDVCLCFFAGPSCGADEWLRSWEGVKGKGQGKAKWFEALPSRPPAPQTAVHPVISCPCSYLMSLCVNVNACF